MRCICNAGGWIRGGSRDRPRCNYRPWDVETRLSAFRKGACVHAPWWFWGGCRDWIGWSGNPKDAPWAAGVVHQRSSISENRRVVVADDEHFFAHTSQTNTQPRNQKSKATGGGHHFHFYWCVAFFFWFLRLPAAAPALLSIPSPPTICDWPSWPPTIVFPSAQVVAAGGSAAWAPTRASPPGQTP